MDNRDKQLFQAEIMRVRQAVEPIDAELNSINADMIELRDQVDAAIATAEEAKTIAESATGEQGPAGANGKSGAIQLVGGLSRSASNISVDVSMGYMTSDIAIGDTVICMFTSGASFMPNVKAGDLFKCVVGGFQSNAVDVDGNRIISGVWFTSSIEKVGNIAGVGVDDIVTIGHNVVGNETITNVNLITSDNRALPFEVHAQNGAPAAVDDMLSLSSINPVQNKVVTAAINEAAKGKKYSNYHFWVSELIDNSNYQLYASFFGVAESGLSEEEAFEKFFGSHGAGGSVNQSIIVYGRDETIGFGVGYIDWRDSTVYISQVCAKDGNFANIYDRSLTESFTLNFEEIEL